MGTLDGKVAVVTGGSSGIGRATALALAAEGADIAVVGRNAAALDEVAAQVGDLGRRAFPGAVDVRDEAQVGAFFDRTIAELGRVDIVVNNAGVSYPGGIVDGKVEAWRDILDTNLLALLICCREAVRVMRPNGRGHIVNMSSGTTRFLRPMGSVYTGAKHAMNYISDALREEVRDLGIQVSCIVPGLTLTNIGRNAPPQVLEARFRAAGADPANARPGEYFADQLEPILEQQPGVYLASEDVARAVVYAVTQPYHVEVENVVVRPRLGLTIEGEKRHDR
jgi:NAD(P)-dependent dehydrogenase (short-subunit alcohol dehydrogenase family)